MTRGSGSLEQYLQHSTLRTVRGLRALHLHFVPSGMVADLSRGPGVGASGDDQFIFVSDTTVPTKSFQGTQTLFRDLHGKSSMCVAPWGIGKQGWADGGVAVKHSQWVVLNRKHASLSVSKQDQPPINYFWKNGEGCVDEFWLYHRIFGPLHVGESRTSTGHSFSEHNFHDMSAQQFWSAMSKVHGLDRRCLTYFDMSNTINDRLAIGQPVPHAPVFMGKDKQPHDADSSRLKGKFGPAHIEHLSLKHLREWMESPLAFIRKVDGKTSVEGGITLSEALESTWR